VTKVDHLVVPNKILSKVFPSCYRRLWCFSEEARALGLRICLLDIDMVILGDITELLDSKTANFVAWCGKDGLSKIAGGIWLLSTGTHTEVWDTFDVATSPALAAAAGHRGSDQAWISLRLYPPKEYWTANDGISKLNWLRKSGQPPPPGTKMVFTTGLQPPWSPALQLGHTWIQNHWHL
jgi:hypothetical protein